MNQAEPVSTCDLAARLDVSCEYARRLIAKSGRGLKNERGSWSISRTWAEKFCRLRKLCRATKKVDIDFILDMPRFRTLFKCRLVSGEVEEDISLSEDELLKLTEIFGPLPLNLCSEDASVLRMVEAFNTKRSGSGMLRRSWTDDWADRIDRAGTLQLACETIRDQAPVTHG